jgi:hypothetical protein
MVRFSLLAAGLLVSILSIGCCGPMGCGPGCGSYACNDCDGGCGPTMPCSPMDGMRQFKRSLVCGGGCGEAYMGEWISTPPDACDPCCGDQWVGGAVRARPFCGQRLACWQPGALLGRLYGGRYCSGAESAVPCGCESGVCDGGCVTEGYVEGEIISSDTGGGCSTGNCGCANCGTRGALGSGIRMARGIPASDGLTRSSSTRSMDLQVNRIRR